MRVRWTRVLGVSLALEVLLSLLVNAQEFGELLDGRRTVGGFGAAAGLVVTGAIIVSAAAVGRSLLTARRDLHRRTESLAADVRITTDWVWESDTEHRLTYSSDGVRDLLGYDPQDLIGRSALTLLPPEQRAAAEQLVQRALDDRDGWDVTTMRWQAADGRDILLRGRAAPIKDERGTIVGFRGSRRALTPAELAQTSMAATSRRVHGLLESRAADVALQPIVDLGSGRLAGVEALARFRDGRSPDTWFDEAREAGLSLELDRFAFGNALAALEALPGPAYLSINATPELLLSGHLAPVLLGHGLPLGRVVVEITEHARIDDYDELHRSLDSLREQGLCLAIDDTGAGYASLSHVLRLRPDIIKLDRSLITSITSDPARRSLVTALVLLALDLGASVTAEGIETPSELETLATLGVDRGQGYLLGRPTTDQAQWQTWTDRDWLGQRAPAT